MTDSEEQMKDIANNINDLSNAEKVDEARQELERARDLINQEYGQPQPSVPETQR